MAPWAPLPEDLLPMAEQVITLVDTVFSEGQSFRQASDQATVFDPQEIFGSSLKGMAVPKRHLSRRFDGAERSSS